MCIYIYTLHNYTQLYVCVYIYIYIYRSFALGGSSFPVTQDIADIRLIFMYKSDMLQCNIDKSMLYSYMSLMIYSIIYSGTYMSLNRRATLRYVSRLRFP